LIPPRKAARSRRAREISGAPPRSERLEAERAAGDPLFRGLLEAAPDAIVIVDGTGSIVLVNSQAERMFGYPRAELIGQPIEILVPARFRAVHGKHRADYVPSPRVLEMKARVDLTGVRKDGSEFPVEIGLSPLATDDGVLIIGAIRDVTARKKVERALQEKNVELEKASFAKDRFLAHMSHELRSPLTAVIGFTGTLLMRLPGPLTPDREHQLQTVASSARHLLSLINDVLDMTKIESGKFDLHPAPVSCRRIAKEIVETLRPIADAKGLTLELCLPTDDLVIETDRRALSQILINLTNNAIKFTDLGIVRVDLREAGDRSIEFAIADSGIGISAADQDGLFRAFTRFGAAAAQRPGTGLGLHLSQQLAQLLGGSIRCASELGKGSTFTLTLARS
jgi:protein-histidine pros-kinase